MLTIEQTTEGFELHLNGCGLGYMINVSALGDLTKQYGLDVQTEIGASILEMLKEEFDNKIGSPMFGGLFEARTRLELSIAVSKVWGKILESNKTYQCGCGETHVHE